jgi:hypothetical protein
MSNLLKNLVKEDWWSDMSPGEQAAYIKRHPGSKKAQDAKKKEKGDDKPKSRDEKPNYDDDNYAKKTDDMQADVGKKYGVSAMDIYSASDKEPEDFDSWDEYESHLNDVAKKLKDKGYSDAWAADDEADDMKWDDAQDSRDAEDKKDAGIKPIKADADTKRMGDSIQRKIGGSKDPDRLELQGTQEASNGETIIQFKDKDDGSMVGVDAQGNIYEDGEKQNYGVDVSTQSDVFGADQNQQLLYKQKKARETGGQDPFARTGKELNKEDFLKENPIVAATVMHMTKMHMKNPQTGRTIKATTPLRNPEHPLHGKSVSIFKKIKDKLTPDKKEEPKKQSQADADFYKKQFAGRSGKELEEDIIRKVIRQEIKSIMKEDDEAFSQPIPAQIDRYMKKFIGAMTGKNLNRKRKLAILGRVIVALRLDPSEVSKYARLVKREL